MSNTIDSNSNYTYYNSKKTNGSNTSSNPTIIVSSTDMIASIDSAHC